MKNWLVSLLTLSALCPQPSNAYEYQYEYDRIVVECRGYVDKFSIFLESFIDPKNQVSPTTNLEIGYVVKTWKPMDFVYVEEPKVTGASVELEGSVSGGEGIYKMELPWGNLQSNSNNFTTALTLKTSLVNGNVTVNCKASLQKIRTKTEYQYH